MERSWPQAATAASNSAAINMPQRKEKARVCGILATAAVWWPHLFPSWARSALKLPTVHILTTHETSSEMWFYHTTDYGQMPYVEYFLCSFPWHVFSCLLVRRCISLASVPTPNHGISQRRMASRQREGALFGFVFFSFTCLSMSNICCDSFVPLDLICSERLGHLVKVCDNSSCCQV